MKTFLSLFFFAIGINIGFAMLTYLLFRGQIRGATSFIDYFHYAIGNFTTNAPEDMVPETDGVKVWTSLYVITAWVYIFYVTINHITNV